MTNPRTSGTDREDTGRWSGIPNKRRPSFLVVAFSHRCDILRRGRETSTIRSQQQEEPAEQPLPLRSGSLLTKPVMSAYGCVSALFQLAFFPRLVARFGPGRVVVATAVAFGVLYALFPFENMLARDSGTASAVWPLIVLQLVTISVSDMGLSCSVGPDCGFASTVFFEGSVFMFVSSTAPNKRSLGALNGLSQTVVSTQRAVGPVAAAALFASSLHNNVLGRQFANAVLLSLALEAALGKSPSNRFLAFGDPARRAVTTQN
ncbi:hypothetical protein EDB92DRAFT_2115372 [Lactarius akahatsu]|uniref:Uncharacterized protein n=1 Tax=Lactarius akahatsu TaxID=416441 RepID=A0AAD4LEG7_9AGAM|nr:hypothetical protein EDB92DRAFT_2115372 [Lactarius akahatsu]